MKFKLINMQKIKKLIRVSCQFLLFCFYEGIVQIISRVPGITRNKVASQSRGNYWHKKKYPHQECQGTRKGMNNEKLTCYIDGFDASWYMKDNLDVDFRNIEAYEHYIKIGKYQARHPHFDEAWYKLEYSDLDFSKFSAIDQYLTYGKYEGRHPSLNSYWYLNEYQDVREASVDASQHYALNGKKECRHPAFDRTWYINNYNDVATSGMDAYEHYISVGKEEGRYPAFDRNWYLINYPDVAAAGVDPFKHFLEYGKSEGRRPAFSIADAQKYNSRTENFPDYYDSEYQNNIIYSDLSTDIKALAFYLPQFHECKQNNLWWGDKFTEWTNTSRALPQFANHYQPREPHVDIGYYDLSIESDLIAQARLAREHGIYGFCMYYYWFSGDRALEKPLDIIFGNKSIDINFCLCWANENWTRTWDGMENDVLLEQKYLEEDPVKFIRDISKYISDPRYIKVDGKPIIIVYKPHVVPRFKKVIDTWRSWWKNNIGGEILIWCNRTNFDDTGAKSLVGIADAIVEFPPHVVPYEIDQSKLNYKTSGHFFDYQHLVNDIICGTERTETPELPFYRTAMLGWDNSARRKVGWSVWYGFSLEIYYKWLVAIIDYTRSNFGRNDRFIFINAWNEWAEGTYLEPDKRCGYASINTTSKAIFDLPFHSSPYVLQNSDICSSGDVGLLAIHFHVYYIDLIDEVIGYINNIPFNFDLFVTVDDDDKASVVLTEITRRGKQKLLRVVVCKNIGRDVYPFLSSVSKQLLKYDFIGHFHTKKSDTVNWGESWRNFIFENLLGSSQTVSGIFSKFITDPNLGLIHPPAYPLIAPYADWGGVKDRVAALLHDMGCKVHLPSRPNFPVGNMFWARKSAIENILSINWDQSDFELEHGQVMGTLPHVVERCWRYLASHNGYNSMELIGRNKKIGAYNKPKRLILFAHHDYNNEISKEDLFYIKELRNIAQTIIFTSVSNISASSLSDVSKFVDEIVIRENIGFDFSSWRDSILKFGFDRLSFYDEIVFANNSCYGPIFPFDEMFYSMDGIDCDFWGITAFPFSENSTRAEAALVKGTAIPAHVQSYFMVFKRGVVNSSVFKDFWSNVRDFSDMLKVIANYEIQLTTILSSAGFKWACYLPESIILQERFNHLSDFNATYNDPTSFIMLRSPLIKKKSIVYSPNLIPGAKELVKSFNFYPSEMFFGDLE